MIEIHRDQHFTSPIFNGWSSWNNQLDIATKKIVQSAIRCLPDAAQQVIGETCLTQSKLMVDSLGKVIWLQSTIGNPLLSPWIAGTLGVLGIITTAKPFCQYVQSHVRSVVALSSHNRVGCIAVPILFGVIEIIAIYQAGFYSPNRIIECISMSLWFSYIAELGTVAFHATGLQQQRKEELTAKYFADEAEAMRIRIIQYSIQLESEIKELKEKIRKVDLFVESHPELKQICMEHLRGHMSIYGDYKPSTSHLDPDNYIDRKTLLVFKRNSLERELKERKRFIDRWPKVKECFLKYMQQEESRKSAVVPYNGRDFSVHRGELNNHGN